jgi:hypothetical protein
MRIYSHKFFNILALCSAGWLLFSNNSLQLLSGKRCLAGNKIESFQGGWPWHSFGKQNCKFVASI